MTHIKQFYEAIEIFEKYIDGDAQRVMGAGKDSVWFHVTNKVSPEDYARLEKLGFYCRQGWEYFK